MKPVPPGESKAGKDNAAEQIIEDEPAPLPTEDDDGRAAADPPNGDDDGKPAKPEQDDDARRAEVAKKKPPSDSMRDQIAARFSENRDQIGAGEDAGDDDGDQGGADDGAQQDQDGKAAKPAEDGGGKPGGAGQFDLVVNGKTIKKSISEVAQLADMTEDEVREAPERAIRFARRELATIENLDRSKRSQQRQPDNPGARTSSEDKGDDPARSSARSQGDDATGSRTKDDNRNDARNPSDDIDFVQLAEAIQLEDPKDVAEKLKNVFSKVANDAASQQLSSSRIEDAVKADRNSVRTAMNQFLDDHQDIQGKRYVASAIAGALIDEYRADIRSVLIDEGQDPAEVDAVLATAPADRVANEHMRLRIQQHPKVRQIDKGMIETAYGKVSSDFGGSPKQQQQNNQNLQTTRRERKEALTPQPRRANVPPATNRPAPQQASRSSAVAAMAAARGQKGPTSPR